PIGAAIAAAVEGDHPRVAGEIGDLRLPSMRVAERPGGEQQDRGLALTKDFEEDLDAPALDKAVVIGIPRAHHSSCPGQAVTSCLEGQYTAQTAGWLAGPPGRVGRWLLLTRPRVWAGEDRSTRPACQLTNVLDVRGAEESFP